MSAQWTIVELAEQVAASLESAADGREGQPSARVREVPNARTIRWYQTTGMVDRPAGLRGRTALYGRRHLLQLVAIKRLQAQGRSLADVQAELAGLPTDAIARIADLESERDATEQDGARSRFWAASPAAPAPPAQHPAVAPQAVTGLRLADGVLLVLDHADHAPTATDLAAVRESAATLLDTLRSRGLSPLEES